MLRVFTGIARRAAALVLGAVSLAALAGCAGEDLSRANYQRVTVTAEAGSGGQGEVPQGEITDPAVGVSALRGVDACKLLAGAVSSLGKVGEPTGLDWSQCNVDVTDAGGKAIDLSLTLADISVYADEATGGVGGLPLIEKKQDETCFTTAVISREPSLGITVQARYEGADPCGPGYPVLERVLQGLRGDPPRHPEKPGSLRGVDPCEAVGQDALTEVLGSGPLQQPAGLYTCQFDSQEDSDRSVRVAFRGGYPPEPGDGGQPVDLGKGVRGVRATSGTDVASCDVEWTHGRPAGENSELARVEFTDYGDEANADQACAAAVELAKSIVVTLPAP